MSALDRAIGRPNGCGPVYTGCGKGGRYGHSTVYTGRRKVVQPVGIGDHGSGLPEPVQGVPDGPLRDPEPGGKGQRRQGSRGKEPADRGIGRVGKSLLPVANVPTSVHRA